MVIPVSIHVLPSYVHTSSYLIAHPAFVFLIMALVTYRLTRLVIEDRIFATPVARFQGWAESRWEKRQLDHARSQLDPDDPTRDALFIAPSEDDQWRSPLAYLLSCPWCLSFYLGWAVVLFTDIISSHSFPHHHPYVSAIPSWWAYLLLVPALSATTGFLFYIEHILSSIVLLASSLSTPHDPPPSPLPPARHIPRTAPNFDLRNPSDQDGV